MGKDTTKTSEARKAGLKKARKKYFSFGLASGLAFHNPESPLHKSYINSKFCADTITVDPVGVSHSQYCKNRWCPLCQSIRIAVLINGYKTQLEQMEQLYFVTLTRPTVPADQLDEQWKKMASAFNSIRHSRIFRRNNWSGLRKVECTIRPNDLYHLHFHLLIDSKEGAEFVVKRWLEINSESDPQAQDIREVNMAKGGFIDIFKYFTKLIAKVQLNKKKKPKEEDFARYIDYKRLDVIFQFMKGKRVFQPFGDLHPVEEDFEDEDLDGQMLGRLNSIWQWCTSESDWYEVNDGDGLTGYVPSEGFKRLLKGKGG